MINKPFVLFIVLMILATTHATDDLQKRFSKLALEEFKEDLKDFQKTDNQGNQQSSGKKRTPVKSQQEKTPGTPEAQKILKLAQKEDPKGDLLPDGSILYRGEERKDTFNILHKKIFFTKYTPGTGDVTSWDETRNDKDETIGFHPKMINSNPIQKPYYPIEKDAKFAPELKHFHSTQGLEELLAQWKDIPQLETFFKNHITTLDPHMYDTLVQQWRTSLEQNGFKPQTEDAVIALTKAHTQHVLRENLCDGAILYRNHSRESRYGAEDIATQYIFFVKYHPETGRVDTWNEGRDKDDKIVLFHPHMVNSQEIDVVHFPPQQNERAKSDYQEDIRQFQAIDGLENLGKKFGFTPDIRQFFNNKQQELQKVVDQEQEKLRMLAQKKKGSMANQLTLLTRSTINVREIENTSSSEEVEEEMTKEVPVQEGGKKLTKGQKKRQRKKAMASHKKEEERILAEIATKAAEEQEKLNAEIEKIEQDLKNNKDERFIILKKIVKNIEVLQVGEKKSTPQSQIHQDSNHLHVKTMEQLETRYKNFLQEMQRYQFTGLEKEEIANNHFIIQAAKLVEDLEAQVNNLKKNNKKNQINIALKQKTHVELLIQLIYQTEEMVKVGKIENVTYQVTFEKQKELFEQDKKGSLKERTIAERRKAKGYRKNDRNQSKQSLL